MATLGNKATNLVALPDASVTTAKLNAGVVNGATTVTMDQTADYVLIADGSDSGNFKKALIPSSGATGGGTDKVFYENDQTVNNDYTITSGKNAVSAGPITIASGKTVTVPSGSTWSIV